MKPLTEIYHDWVSSTVDEKGFEIPHGLVVAADGSITVMALAVPPAQAYEVMLKQQASHPVEMIFALDRFAKPGQGTTLGDLLAGFHCTRERARPFIIEYQHAPRIVKSIDWDNEWWNAALLREMTGSLRSHLGLEPMWGRA